MVLLAVALLGGTALVIGLLRRDLVRRLDERIRTAATVTARFPGLAGLSGEKAPHVRDTVEQRLTGTSISRTRPPRDGSNA